MMKEEETIEEIEINRDLENHGSVSSGMTRDMRLVELERRQIENEKLKNDWYLCCSRTSPELIKYCVTVGVSLIVLVFSIIQVALQSENSNIYFNLITFILGFFTKSPSLGKKE